MLNVEPRFALRKPMATLRALAVWGPGLLVMLADTDAGNVVTAAQSGAMWGYRLLPLTLLLIPLLFMVQELTIRLGIFTARGHAALIRDTFGRGWAWLSIASLAVATIGSLITEFTAIAGIGALYGISRDITLPLAVVLLLTVVATGSYRRVEWLALAVGLFEIAFIAVAWAAHPTFAQLASEATRLPLANHAFLYLGAAIIGTTFNPWMIFYQQSATVQRRLRPRDLTQARWDTGIGALLTQCLTGAVLIAAAALLPGARDHIRLETVGDISQAFVPLMGSKTGRLIFSLGVLGASLVAAIVSSLAFAWSIEELASTPRTHDSRLLAADLFSSIYVASVGGAAALAWAVRDLVSLNIAAQVLNAFLMPLVLGFLIALAARVLPHNTRLRGVYLWLVIVTTTIVCSIGIYGGIVGVT